MLKFSLFDLRIDEKVIGMFDIILLNYDGIIELLSIR